MSTRSNIALLKLDGKVEASYCHNSGSLGYVGNMLYMNYRDIDKIKELLSLGEISSLDEDIDSSYFYHRDGQEEDLNKEKYRTFNAYLNKMKSNSSYEYCYLFQEETNQWYLIKEARKMLTKDSVNMPLLEEKMLLSEEISEEMKEDIEHEKALKKSKDRLEKELKIQETKHQIKV